MNPYGPQTRHEVLDMESPPLGIVQHQHLIGPVEDLVLDLDRVRYSGGLPPEWPEGRLEMWQDDDDIYFEARLPEGLTDIDADICIKNGILFMRMGH